MHRKGLEDRKLLIMFPGASARRGGAHLDIQRHSWSADFPDHDVLCFSDPTMTPENRIGLAWFQNHADAFGIAAVETLLREMMDSFGYQHENVHFFGSSGGGFVAMWLANRFPASQVTAINPQIYLVNYTRSFFEDMLEHCYPGLSEQEAHSQYGSRLSVKLDATARRAPLVVIQNRHDERHMKGHLEPFIATQDPQHVSALDSLDSRPLNKVNVFIYEDQKMGHTPPRREDTVAMLRKLL
jgi:pimeloyl-ACP methyl ester carboxylesterase